MKGEDDKPLPLSKPRKPYKRNLESKVKKAEGKRKMTQSERELDSEVTNYIADENLVKKKRWFCHSSDETFPLAATHPNTSRYCSPR